MGNTRAFIKVQDGCKTNAHFVTTIARGDGVSRHLADIVTEIQGIGAGRLSEVVLTGVHLAATATILAIMPDCMASSVSFGTH